MTHIVQQFTPKASTVEAGQALAASLQKQGCTHLVLIMALPMAERDLDHFHALLNFPAQRQRIIAQARNEEPLYDEDAPYPPILDKLHQQYFEDGDTVPVFVGDLADPHHSTAQAFTSRGNAYDAEHTLRILLSNCPDVAGLIGDWPGPITVVPTLEQHDICDGAYEVYEWLSHLVTRLPVDLDFHPRQLVPMAKLAWKVALAADLLLLDRLVETLAALSYGQTIGLVAVPSLYCGIPAMVERLRQYGYEFSPLHSDQLEYPDQQEWSKRLDQVMREGGLQRLEFFELDDSSLLPWILGMLYAGEDDTDWDHSRDISALMELDSNTLDTLWRNVYNVLANGYAQMTQLPEDDEAARKALADRTWDEVEQYIDAAIAPDELEDTDPGSPEA